MIGSFLNVCAHRIPKGESIAYPPSHCPSCNEAIRYVDNIPVLSYIILGGKCRS
ncbi:MAG: prepilin peptidase, partial [Candidatus Aquicultor secundus]